MKTARRIKIDSVVLGLLILTVAIIQGKNSRAGEHQTSFVSSAPTGAVAATKVRGLARVQPVGQTADDFTHLEADLQTYMHLEDANDRDPAKIESAREKMLKNASLLRSLRGFLSRPALDAREAAEQNAGFALLLQATHDAQAEVATETLRLVVADEEMDEILNDNTEPHRHIQSVEGTSDEFSAPTPRLLEGRLLHPEASTSASLGGR